MSRIGSFKSRVVSRELMVGTFLKTPHYVMIEVFAQSGLTSIEIPSTVTSIGDSAFRYCSSLTTVTFQEGSQLTSIGGWTFAFSGLASIEIPSTVISIGDFAFDECSSLTTVSYLL